MSKKKKYILVTTLTLLILLIFFFVLFIISNNNINIDLVSLENTIEEKGEYNFSNMKDIDNDFLINELGIDEEYFEIYIGKIPRISVSANMYIVIKSTSTYNANYILERLEKYLINYEESWSNYLISEYNIVKNRKIGKIGKYVYLFIVENSENLENELLKYNR